ncbi:MAG: hypothetical protein AAF483_12945 [Planctomycetota bacterium]
MKKKRMYLMEAVGPFAVTSASAVGRIRINEQTNHYADAQWQTWFVLWRFAVRLPSTGIGWRSVA